MLDSAHELQGVNHKSDQVLGELTTAVLSAPAQAANQALLSGLQARRDGVVNTLFRAVGGKADAFAHSAESSWRLGADVVEGIHGANNNYLRLRADLAKGYAEFYKDVSGLNAAIKKSLSEGSAADKVGFHKGNLYWAINAIRKKWDVGASPGLPLPRNPNPISSLITTQAEVDKEYGAGFFLVDSVTGTVNIDTSVLGKISGTLWDDSNPNFDGPINGVYRENVSTNAEFNAWRTGYDGFEQQISTQMRQAAERYSQANSKFDNLVSVLLKVLNGLYESDKAYFS
jgi:hypothetical protein